jgi:2'-5' RNA ligase
MTRTFVALEMNNALQSHLAGIIRQVAQALPGIHWADASSIHLTLAFLGELTDDQVTEAIEATEMAAQQAQPFSYCLSHLGTFGSPRYPRVVWMGIEEASGSLVAIHRILNKQLLKRGFEVETRPFSPHLTLARLKSSLSSQDLQTLQSLLADEPHRLASTESYPVRYLDVMKSELQHTGARYMCLQSCPIGKG